MCFLAYAPLVVGFHLQRRHPHARAIRGRGHRRQIGAVSTQRAGRLQEAITSSWSFLIAISRRPRLVKGERSRRPRQGSRWGDDWEVRRWWERRPDAADELVEAWGVEHAAGSHLPGFAGRLIAQARTHQEARCSNAGGAQAPDHFVPVDIRQPPVNQQEIGLQGFRDGEGFGAGCRRGRRKPFEGERTASVSRVP